MGTLFLNLYSTSPPHKLLLLEVTIIVKKINIYDYFSRDIPRKNFDRSDEEKEELLREFGFEKNEKKGYTFSHNVFSRAFRRYVIIKLLQNNEPVIYNQKLGIYERDCSETIEKLIKYCMNLVYDLWCPYYAQVALKTIVHDTFDVVQQFNSGDYINLRNGVLDLNTYSMHEHTPDYYSTVQLPFEYSTASPTPVFNRFMEDITCGDKDMQLLLQEMMGYCLCTSTAAEKAFYLFGAGCNGKSLFAQVLISMVGDDNYSSATLTALNGTFGLASLINANVNIAAENNGRVNSEIFKAIVSGDVVEVNRKYRDAISVKLHTKLVLLFNELPDSTDLTYGYFRKIIVIPFRKTVSREEMDVNLINKLKLELSGIFHWAVEGLKRLRRNSYQFTYCQACEDALDAYKQTLNPIAAFFEQYFEVNPSASIKKSDIYKIYSEYCYANAVECYPCQKFWRLLKAHCADKNYQFATKKIRGYEYLVGLKAK